MRNIIEQPKGNAGNTITHVSNGTAKAVIVQSSKTDNTPAYDNLIDTLRTLHD
tara:strand:+ start:4210 stop:4368 length:159 start_codon:yes stop_codon:yes gene_type:complete